MTDPRNGLWRSRWAAIGAAVAVTLGAGGGYLAHGASTGASTFVPTSPCRLADTRASSAIGPRTTPIGAGQSVEFIVRGSNGQCTGIPTDATGVALNATIVNPSASSFLTIYPSDVTRPNASNLNWAANQNPTPNKVDVKLSADGKISAFNLFGNVDLILDIVGYYEPPAVAGSAAAPQLFATNYGDNVTSALGTLKTPIGVSPTPTLLAKLTIPHSAGGSLQVTATANIFLTRNALVRCSIEANDTTLVNAPIHALRVQPVDDSSDLERSVDLSFSRAYNVPAGTDTLNLLCIRVSGTNGTAAFADPSMSVLYLPGTRLQG